MECDDVDVMVSIVVPTMNRPDTLGVLLDRLDEELRKTGPEWEVETLLCNDGEFEVSDPPPWCEVVDGPRRGPAANRNAGLARARGEFFILVDDDCVPQPGWLAAYLGAFVKPENEGIEIFEGATRADRPQRRLDETSPLNESGGYFWTCNLGLRREAFDVVGPLDERFRYADLEDVEWAERCRRAGVRTTFVHEAVVHHPYRIRRPIRELRTHAESVPVLVSAHPDLGGLFTRRAYLGMATRDLKRIVLTLAPYNGRGLPRALLKTCCYLYLAARPPGRARLPG